MGLDVLNIPGQIKNRLTSPSVGLRVGGKEAEGLLCHRLIHDDVVGSPDSADSPQVGNACPLGIDFDIGLDIQDLPHGIISPLIVIQKPEGFLS